MGDERPAWIALDWNGTVAPFFGRDPYPGALETVTHARRLGWRVIVVSHASQRAVEEDVRRTGLDVDGVVGCDDKGEVFRALRERHGAGIAIGDHPSDQRAAREAGLEFCQARLEGQSRFADSDDSFESWSEFEARLLAGADAGGDG